MDILLFVILVLFAVATFFQLLYSIIIYGRFSFVRKKDAVTDNIKHPVSVVICARNEYNNLEKNLHLVLEQDYPNFEVVVVNDYSDDDSTFLLEQMQKKYSNLRVVTLSQQLNFFKGKKFPLSIGIKAAKNEILLLTDADCYPNSNQWINNMQRHFDDNTDVVLGYGGYKSDKGLLNKIIQFDTMKIAIQYFSMALFGRAYMGVGRNLAYRKSVFYKYGGFTEHYKISSGDDDLFINKVSNKKNTKIECSVDSFTISEPKKSFSLWCRQKKRHLSTGKYYKFVFKAVLGLNTISLFTLYISFAFLVINATGILLYSVIVGFAAVLIMQLLVYYFGFNKLNNKKQWLLAPLFEIFFVIFNPLFYLANSFNKQNKWK